MSIMVAGAGVWILFYGSYVLKMFLQKRQGISTDRMGRGQKARRTYWIEVCLKTTTYLLAGIQLLSILWNSSYVTSPAVRYTGVGLAFLGTIIFIIAMATMKNSWRAGVDETQQTKMVTKGIYRYSRNPAFLGFDLLYLGLALAYSNIALILVTIMGIVILHLQILEEERFLPKAFGEEYIAYKMKTGRYFWLI